MFEKVTAKYDGRFIEKNINDLDISNYENPSDSDVLSAMSLAIQSETGVRPDLSDFVVDRGDTVLNIRPQATYG